MSSVVDPNLQATPGSEPDVSTSEKSMTSAVDREPGAPSDVDLMLGIQSGDADALSQLYDRYSGIMKALILRIIHNETEKDVEAGDTRVLMAKVINSLPEAQQQVIELAFFQGMSQREIAFHTNVPLGTVKTRLELGLKKIYDRLKELRDEL